MKKTLLFIATVLTIGSANAQVYITDDWTGGTLTSNNNWITYTTNGSFDWVASDLGSTGDFYARMSNYDGANNLVESWLITPALDLSGATDPYLSFRNAYNFNGAPLEMYVSTNYTGTGDPNAATWTDITSSATWSGGSFNWANSGDISLSSYLMSGVYIGYKYNGSASDGSTWEIDDFLIQEGQTVNTITSIYDIQFSTAPGGESPQDGNVVTTKGVVTGVYQIGTNADRFFIQDGDGAWNGIYVYENGYTVAIGDSVLVTGEVTEYFGLTEISFVSDVTILNSGNAMPNPAVVTNATLGNEEYEGVLVTLEDAICITTENQYGEWTANDGTATFVTIDDDLLPAMYSPVLGDGYDITGIRHFAFDLNIIYPTSSSQIVTVGWAGIDENHPTFSIYPNPATDVITLNVDPTAIVNVYSISGAAVYTGTATNTIDVSNLDAGIYTVAVTTNGVTESQRLVIR